MAVQPTDLKFYYSAHSTTVANNTGSGTINSLGGAITANEIPSGQLQNLFDNVPAIEASAGRTEYRCIYVSNQNLTPQTLYEARVFIETNTASPTTTVEIALDPAGIDADSTIQLADEIDSTNLVSSLAFSSPQDYANGLPLGDLNGNGGKYAIWVRRVVSAGTAAASESAVISIQGETDS